MEMLSAPFPSNFHFNLWPRKVVILFGMIFLIFPDDPLGIVLWLFMRQVPPVVVVPVEVWAVACCVPPGTKKRHGAVNCIMHIIIPVLGCESMAVVPWQWIFDTWGIWVISGDAEVVQRTRLHLEPVVEGNVGHVLEVLELHHQLPGALACNVGDGLQAQPEFCGNIIFLK